MPRGTRQASAIVEHRRTKIVARASVNRRIPYRRDVSSARMSVYASAGSAASSGVKRAKGRSGRKGPHCAGAISKRAATSEHVGGGWSGEWHGVGGWRRGAGLMGGAVIPKDTERVLRNAGGRGRRCWNAVHTRGADANDLANAPQLVAAIAGGRTGGPPHPLSLSALGSASGLGLIRVNGTRCRMSAGARIRRCTLVGRSLDGMKRTNARDSRRRRHRRRFEMANARAIPAGESRVSRKREFLQDCGDATSSIIR